jgi:hypothetical protein
MLTGIRQMFGASFAQELLYSNNFGTHSTNVRFLDSLLMLTTHPDV